MRRSTVLGFSMLSIVLSAKLYGCAAGGDPQPFAAGPSSEASGGFKKYTGGGNPCYFLAPEGWSLSPQPNSIKPGFKSCYLVQHKGPDDIIRPTRERDSHKEISELVRLLQTVKRFVVARSRGLGFSDAWQERYLGNTCGEFVEFYGSLVMKVVQCENTDAEAKETYKLYEIDDQGDEAVYVLKAYPLVKTVDGRLKTVDGRQDVERGNMTEAGVEAIKRSEHLECVGLIEADEEDLGILKSLRDYIEQHSGSEPSR